MEQFEKVISLFKQAHEKVILRKEITVYGYQFNYQYDFIGGISKYLFSNLEINEFLAPLKENGGMGNRSGMIKESTEFVVVHDTASTAETAGATAHANYVRNGGGGTSWHYSSGCDGVYHQVPDNEVAFHAGDGTVVPFELHWTGIKAEYDAPLISIRNGKYFINGKKTLVSVPKVDYICEDGIYYIASNGIKQSKKLSKSELKDIEKFVLDDNHINDYGIHIVIKEDGYYYIGNTYYNSTYNKIANRGGNLRSIGIEMMINKGSNLSFTYHNTAKLVAKLLVENNLGLDRVKAHHFFSGKNCPQTLRANGLWEYFLSLVKCEYELLLVLNNLKVEFICEHPFVDKNGIVKEIPKDIKNIRYKLRLTSENRVEEIEFNTIVK